MEIRKVDAYCEVCEEVRSCVLRDPGSCQCVVCGHIILMMTPVGSD